MATRFFEDFKPGDTNEFGSYAVTAEEIIEFAKKYDPQPFHVDIAEGERSMFKGLIASGWHTASMCMRMQVDHFLGPASGSIGSPGIDELRWLKPVRPGDVLRLKTEVVDATPSRSKPDRGTLRLRYAAMNQRDEVVMTMVGLAMFLRRPTSTLES